MSQATFGRGLTLTGRDWQLLEHIDYHPFTVEQLLAISCVFTKPFTQTRLLQRRLKRLAAAGFVRSWPYATTGSSPHYFKLTRNAFRLLHGPDAQLPGRRHFEAIAPGRHLHTRALGDFLVRLFVSASPHRIAVRNFARENALRLEADGYVLFPDCAFELHLPAGQVLRYAVELDNGTERVRSDKEVDSLERKLRGYDAHQAQFAARDPRRYVALFLTTRSAIRLENIMRAAREVMSNPKRTVFLGGNLATLLAHPNPMTDACMVDNRGRQRGLLPPRTNGPDAILRRTM